MKILTAIGSELIYLFLKSFIFLVRITPHPIAMTTGRVLGVLFWIVSPYHRKIVRLQMKTVLGPAYYRMLPFKAFMHFGMLPIEIVKFTYLDDSEVRKRLVVEGMENVEAALATGRGLMCITGHVGNWEILANIARFIGGKLHIVMDIRRDPKQESIISDIRSRLPGVKVLPPKGGIISTLIETLKQGKRVGMMVDQRHQKKYGTFCDVMGLPAPSTPAPAFIALKADAIILPVYMKRLGLKRYRVCFEKPIDPRDFGTLDEGLVRLSDGAGAESVQKLSSQIQSWISSAIMAAPDQWLWVHSRWLRRNDMKKIIKKKLDFRQAVFEQARQVKD
jgi:KDO2-lipid IV(A) lauroyltransferase